MGRENLVPFNKPFISGKELDYISEAVLSYNHISGNGVFTQRCQEWLERTLGTNRALLTHSCTAALEMAAILCGIEPGDEVIMPSFTFVSTANAFVLRGAVPVFVDIRPDTLNIDENLLSLALSSKTKAVVPVHYAGVPCAMDAICTFAKNYGLRVVEDAAQALLSEDSGRAMGTIGDIGCLSFHETKNIISGEGGALLVNDPELVERAEIIWQKGTDRTKFEHGIVDKYTWVDVGSSFLPSELVAAFLYAQMTNAEKIIKRRKELCSLYATRLTPLMEAGRMSFPRLPLGNGHIFFCLARSHAEQVELLGHLRNRGVSAVFHYVPLHSSVAGRRFGRTCGDLAVTDELSSRLLRLPLYYQMTEQEVGIVVDALFEFYNV